MDQHEPPESRRTDAPDLSSEALAKEDARLIIERYDGVRNDHPRRRMRTRPEFEMTVWGANATRSLTRRGL